MTASTRASPGVAGMAASTWSSVSVTTAERVPPPGLAGLAGQLDQPVPFGAGHAVQFEKGPNVAGLGAAPPGLDAEQGRRRPLQLPRHLFPAHPGGLAPPLQLHGQAASAQGRVLSWITTSGHGSPTPFRASSLALLQIIECLCTLALMMPPNQWQSVANPPQRRNEPNVSTPISPGQLPRTPRPAAAGGPQGRLAAASAALAIARCGPLGQELGASGAG